MIAPTFFMVRDDAIRVERVERTFVVYADDLQSLGERAAQEGKQFYGDLSFRITLLDVKAAPSTTDRTLMARAYTEYP